ncbi:hypothetical protein L3X38_004148 [Prunus dulcis]|uniref:DUF4218 domain-containing protein n=1 Tax=Prunus dulcis TaxID=3755 RepID=A0AAD5F2V7_PRUDU|nr:hypothetical protein L3X38_004148 [Prunus dulcis]
MRPALLWTINDYPAYVYMSDVMHIEKNVFENVIGTMMSIDGKTKDSLNARLDLQEMGIRHKYHLEEGDNEHNIYGMKTHDCHELCAKVLREDDLNLLENQIVITLCKLEKIFAPALFDIMIHLTCNLAWEAKVAGPVQFSWMYLVERYLHKLKTYVRNKAHPEGSIAEGVLGDGCLIFCSRYLHQVETKFNKRDRNDDGGQPSYDTSPLSIFSTLGRGFGKGVLREMSIELHKAATHYVLQNCDEPLAFVLEHKNILIQSSVDNVEKSHRLQFSN